MSPLRRGMTRAGSTHASLSETIALARRYVLQETLGPLKHIAKVLGLGLAGALVYGIGLALVLLGLLRVLQAEAGSLFSGSYSFAPYFITAIIGTFIVALTIAVELKGGRKKEAPPRR